MLIQNIKPNYFVTEAIESGTFTFTYGSGISAAMHTSMSYSLNGSTWITLYNVDSTEVSITTPTISAGAKVYWKGTGYGLCENRSNGRYGYFSSTGNFNVSGNAMSLIYGDEGFETKTALRQRPGYTSVGTFFQTFNRSNKLISAGNLLLPATTLVARAYQEMFYECTALVSAPKILPATSFPGSYAYASMFFNCKALLRAPVLPAENLRSGCYYQMFQGCTGLNYLKAMFVDANPSSVSQAILRWVDGVSGTGTFVKNANALWTTSYGDIVPTNFTVVTE